MNLGVRGHMDTRLSNFWMSVYLSGTGLDDFSSGRFLFAIVSTFSFLYTVSLKRFVVASLSA